MYAVLELMKQLIAMQYVFLKPLKTLWLPFFEYVNLGHKAL